LYDSGEIILQARVSLDENETPDTLAAKIHQLEQAYFPVAIEQVLLSQN
jgi:phosphoribosylglycinamide formyltransferase-1